MKRVLLDLRESISKSTKHSKYFIMNPRLDRSPFISHIYTNTYLTLFLSFMFVYTWFGLYMVSLFCGNVFPVTACAAAGLAGWAGSCPPPLLARARSQLADSLPSTFPRHDSSNCLWRNRISLFVRFRHFTRKAHLFFSFPLSSCKPR